MATVRLQIQIEMNEDKLRELESLMQECGIRTKKDLMNDALTLFKWAVNKRKSGHEIVAVNSEKGRYTELHMLALSAVRRAE